MCGRCIKLSFMVIIHVPVNCSLSTQLQCLQLVQIRPYLWILGGVYIQIYGNYAPLHGEGADMLRSNLDACVVCCEVRRHMRVMRASQSLLVLLRSVETLKETYGDI